MNLGQIRDSARVKSDEQATGFLSNAQFNGFVNQAHRFIYGKIAQRFEDYFIVKGTALNGGLFDSVAETQSYSLPATMLKVVRVEHRDVNSTSDNDWRRIERTNSNNDHVNDYFPVRPGYSPYFSYFIAGNQIHLRPIPREAFTVRLWFVPMATDMSSDTDEPSLPSPYHELVAEYASIQALRISGEGIWRENLEIFKLELENLLETIEFRDQSAETMTMTDVQDKWIYGL
jgi:hypothetical protein